METDSNHDGHTDTWQYYAHGSLIRMETDESRNGKVECKVFYKNNLRQKLIRDIDDDGFFELTQIFTNPAWSMVVTRDGQINFRETFNSEGKLIQSMEDSGGTEKLDITWFYDENEQVVKGEQDTTGDRHAGS